MKHITFADNDLLVGNDAADVLLEYAATLAEKDSADVVTLRAISSDGDEVEAALLLDQGAPLMAETSRNALPEPDNGEVVQYMRERIELIRYPPSIQADVDRPDQYPTDEIG